MSERLQPPVSASSDGVETCPACGHEAASTRCDGCGAALRVRGYRIERVLGKGGQGRVYLARGPDGRAVALKELVFASAPDTATIDAFNRETALLRQLEHPQVPRFYESFSEGAGVHLRLYQVQEHVESKSLQQRIEEGPLSRDEVKGLARQLLEVLGALHGREPPVVHRDLKPGNVLLRPDGRVMLVDFGVARTLERGATHGSTLVGTFGYAAPEQLGGTVSPASDLYSLGATLAHALLRKPPDGFISPTLELRFDEEPALEGWETLLGGLLQRRPQDRFRSAAEAVKALESPSRRRGKRRLLAAMAVAATVTLAWVAAGALARRPSVVPEPVPRAAPVLQLQPTSRHLSEVFERLRSAKTAGAKAAALQELTYGSFAKERLPDDAEAVMAPLLDDADVYVRRLAFGTLRHPQLRSRGLFPRVMAHVKDADPSIQAAAATAAGEILSHAPQDAETEAMADELVEFVFSNPEGDAQIFAGSFVPTIHPLSAKALKTIRAHVHSGKGQHLAMLFGHLPALHIDEREAVELMGSSVGDERHLAIGAAGLLSPTPSLTAALGKVAAEDTDAMRRLDALKVLEQLAPPAEAATPVFVNALSDHDAMVRERAAEALGAHGSASAEVLAALQRLDGDEAEKVREAAKAAREELGRRAGR